MVKPRHVTLSMNGYSVITYSLLVSVRTLKNPFVTTFLRLDIVHGSKGSEVPHRLGQRSRWHLANSHCRDFTRLR